MMELLSLNDVGPVMAESIYNYFHDENNIKMFDELKNSGESKMTALTD